MPTAQAYSSKIVASSVDRHVDNITREIHVGSDNEKFRATEHWACGKNHDGRILINVRAVNQTLWMVVHTGTQVSYVEREFHTP